MHIPIVVCCRLCVCLSACLFVGRSVCFTNDNLCDFVFCGTSINKKNVFRPTQTHERYLDMLSIPYHRHTPVMQ